MWALIYDAFGAPPRIAHVPDVQVGEWDVALRVLATGLCRSDFHGWQGHDADIVTLPHIPGHEFVGLVCEVGSSVRRWSVGDRVTAPFCCGCGACDPCRAGQAQVCRDYSQPGFTHAGSLAEMVLVRQADFNLVRVPDTIDNATAAILGCRFATAYHGLIDQAQVVPGERVAVFGCGGLGLSAVMIAAAMGARVTAVDIQRPALQLAQEFGAQHALLAGNGETIVEQVCEANQGGVDVAVDALGSALTCQQSLDSLVPRGRMVQVGLLTGNDRSLPLSLGRLIADELRIVGSHGMSARGYPEMLRRITSGQLAPHRLISRRLRLDQAPAAFLGMSEFASAGISVVELAANETIAMRGSRP